MTMPGNETWNEMEAGEHMKPALPPMTTAEMVAALTWMVRGQSPRAPLAAALGMREELTPYLIEALALAPLEVRARADQAPDEDTGYFLHEMAMYLLAGWQEPRGWQLILDFFVSDDDVALDLIDLCVEADLPAMLVRCYDGSDLSAFERIITTPSLDPLFRQVCLQAYHGLVAVGHAPYERFVSFLRSQLDAPADAMPSDWYDWLAYRAAQVQAPELRPAIEALLQRKLTLYSDEYLCLVSLKNLDQIYADDPQCIVDDILHEAVFEDLPDSISRWSWFGQYDDAPPKLGFLDAGTSDSNGPAINWPFQPVATFQRSGPKLGRNDLCHCGSGKKYKKCCLDDDRQFGIAP